MKDLHSMAVTTRKLAGVLTAACCICAPGMAQAGEAEVHGSANGGVTLQAAQSGDDAASPAAGTDANAGLQAGTAVAEAVDDSVLDTVVDSAVQGEIAAAVESSVQGDIQSAIEIDLVTEVTESLPLP
jgi:hypothetical protein